MNGRLPSVMPKFRMAVFLCALLTASVSPGVRAGSQLDTSGQSKDSKHVISSDVRDRIRKTVSSVGLVLVRNSSDPPDQGLRPRGSAVIVRNDGIVATNFHVVARDNSDRLYDEINLSLPADSSSDTPSRQYRLRVVMLNRDYDLALLSIQHDPEPESSVTFPALELAGAREVQVLDDLFIIGYPEKGGSSVTINTGVVEGRDLLDNWIKTDARLIHGNSGGAAVNSSGKLVGIPTRVVADSQPVDRDGDGFPDSVKTYGAVGYLRPAPLVAAMLAALREKEAVASGAGLRPTDPEAPPQMASQEPSVTVRGLIKSAVDGKPIAGARIGIVPHGSQDVTASNLLTWGGTNADGQFELNKPVPPGLYTVKARAMGFEPFSHDIQVSAKMPQVVIELRPSK